MCEAILIRSSAYDRSLILTRLINDVEQLIKEDGNKVFVPRLQLRKNRYIEECKLSSFLGTISTENSNFQPIRNDKDFVTDTQ